MQSFLENACSVASILLFTAALLGTVYFGIKRLRGAAKEKRCALDLPRADAVMTRRDYWNLLWWLVGTTMLVYVVGVAVQMSVSVEPQTIGQHFFNAFQRTDAKNYIIIAKYGYTNAGEYRFFIVFYPLFPYLVRFFAVLFAGNYVAAGFVLNFAFMYASAVVMFKLGILDFPKKNVYAAIGMMLLFPEAFFFHNPYNEPLFLLLSLLSMYCTRKDRYAAAGLVGLLCAFTRAAGAVCAVPIVARSFIAAFQDGKFHPLQWFKKAAWSLLTLCGTGLYLLVNWIVTGDAFMFLVHEREHWTNHFELFPSAFGTITGRMLSNTDAYQAPLWISQFVALFLFLFLMVIGAKRLSTEMSMYGLVYFLMTISMSWLLSAPRYLMVLFPAFYVLGTLLDNKAVRISAYAVSALLLCVMTAYFCMGYCIY